MFCRNCGAQCNDEAIVCLQCGCALKDLSVKEYPQGNGMAVAGFVCSFFCPILGWIFGGIGLSRSKKRKGKGKSFSIAALVIASAIFVISLATL